MQRVEPPDVRFVVYGLAQPAGSKRAFVNPSTGKAIVTDDAKGSRSWKNDVRAAARDAYGQDLLDGPLELTLIFYRPRPKGHSGAKGVRPSAPAYPTTRPDLLKLARGVEDALTGVVYRDDSQIVDEMLEKRFGEPARVEIEIRLLPAAYSELAA